MVPSLLKAIPLGLLVWPVVLKTFICVTSVPDPFDKSKPVANEYVFTSPSLKPTTNILVPLSLKAIPAGLLSWEILKVFSRLTFDDKSKAVCNVYSFTSLPASPTTNIENPLALKAIPLGAESSFLTILKAWIVPAEVISNLVDKWYWSTRSPSLDNGEFILFTTNILSPSALKTTFWGLLTFRVPTSKVSALTNVGPAFAELTKVRLKIKSIEKNTLIKNFTSTE